jgi:hypothetical protein
MWPAERVVARGVVRVAAVALAQGCTLIGKGGAGDGTGTGTTGFYDTEAQCDPTNGDAFSCPPSPATGCSIDDDCCDGRQPSDEPFAGTAFAPGCSGSYPNNWICDRGACKHGGCSDHDDCVLNTYTCEDPTGGDIKACVRKCSDDQDCHEAHMPGTKCIGQIQGGGNYCVEDLP